MDRPIRQLLILLTLAGLDTVNAYYDRRVAEEQGGNEVRIARVE